MSHILLVTSAFLLAFLSFVLGLYSIVRNYKSSVVKIWFLLTMAITGWSSLYLYLITAEGIFSNNTFLLPILYALHFFSLLVPVLFFHFVLCFLFLDIKMKFQLGISYLVFLLFLVLLFFTKLIIFGIQYTPNFGYHAITTPFLYVYILYFYVFIVWSIVLLIKNFLKSSGFIKRRIFFILLASIIGFSAAGTDFLIDLKSIFPYGHYLIWVYPILITYGIFID